MLFCHLLAKNPPAEQFARSAERRFYRLWQTRFALQAASIVILTGGLLFAAKLGLDVFGRQSATEQMRLQTQLDQQRYDAALQALPKIPLTTANLRALVDRYDGVAKRAQGPQPLLVQLSQSLDAFPGISLERLEWKVAEQTEPVPTGQPPVPPAMAKGPYAVANVFARLPIGMVGDQRGQLTLANDFIKHLLNAPDTHIVILQPPVDTQSGKTLKSGDERSTPEAPAFSFRLIRKL
jgi:hypothetical protein